jgi:4-amino-4-deoxychorismate lyase
MKFFSSSEWIQALSEKTSTARSYAAMYSSWVGGFVKDTALMMVPLDDHLVHRGDGVFEAVRSVSGRLYLFEDHLARLERSAEMIGLKSKWSRDQIRDLAEQTLELSGLREAMVRIFLSRGAGDFSTNPYSTMGSELYIVVTRFQPLPDIKYRKGVRVGRSSIAAKPDFFAQMKSCNYLPNVMMKKEAMDRNFDFMIGVSSRSEILESSTENIIFIDQNFRLIRPRGHHILRGCTMMRVCDLARNIAEISEVVEEDRHFSDLLDALEIMMVGTTLDVLPVTEVDGTRVGERGQVGPLSKKLLELVRQDQISS